MTRTNRDSRRVPKRTSTHITSYNISACTSCPHATEARLELPKQHYCNIFGTFRVLVFSFLFPAVVRVYLQSRVVGMLAIYRHIPEQTHTSNYSIYIKSHLIYIAFHIASASRRDLFAGNTFNPQHAADLRSAPHTSLPSECGCGTSAKVGRSDQNGSTSRQRGGTAEFGGSADRPHLFCVQRSLFLWRVCCRL